MIINNWKDKERKNNKATLLDSFQLDAATKKVIRRKKSSADTEFVCNPIISRLRRPFCGQIKKRIHLLKAMNSGKKIAIAEKANRKCQDMARPFIFRFITIFVQWEAQKRHLNSLNSPNANIEWWEILNELAWKKS